jgi:hypothetical protein
VGTGSPQSFCLQRIKGTRTDIALSPEQDSNQGRVQPRNLKLKPIRITLYPVLQFLICAPKFKGIKCKNLGGEDVLENVQLEDHEGGEETALRWVLGKRTVWLRGEWKLFSDRF